MKLGILASILIVSSTNLAFAESNCGQVSEIQYNTDGSVGIKLSVPKTSGGKLFIYKSKSVIGNVLQIALASLNNPKLTICVDDKDNTQYYQIKND